MELLRVVFPEILVALTIMLMQVVAVFRKGFDARVINITLWLFVAIAIFLIYLPVDYKLYNNSFLTSSVINLFKAVILGLTIMSIVIYQDFIKITEKTARMEFVSITFLSTLGIIVSISARDFLLLFCGLELQALAGYALTAFNTKSEKSSEAGLKYFILGALVSALMLMGISFIYGFTGSIYFAEIKPVMASQPSLGIICGMLFVIVAILFKLSAAPLHVWTPDVYEGAPISAVSYFATAQKIGALLVLINILDGVTDSYELLSNNLIKIAAILSMLVGSLGGIGQNSLKRLVAYSTILNVGYILIAISLNSVSGNNVAYIYILIYSISTIGLFSALIALLGASVEEANFDSLNGASYSRKALSAAIAIIMFSMIGLPPFAGFFGKYYVFLSAIEQNEMTLVIMGLLSSVVAAFYYLKIIKHIYFTKPITPFKVIGTQKGLWIVTTISVTFTIFFFIFANNYIV